MNIYLKIITGIMLLGSTLAICLQIPLVQTRLEQYTISWIEDQYGSQPLPPDQEAKVIGIAQAMGITENIRIRKMNDLALSTFGYHNAFFIPSNIWGFLPLADVPFLYFSTGLLEDYPEEEQRFLIGHELIHLRDRHIRFVALLHYASLLLLLLTSFVLSQRFIRWYKRILDRFTDPVELNYLLQGVQACIIAGLISMAFLVPALSSFAYRRCIERAADLESVSLIKSHGGGIAFANRCITELGQPGDWSCWQGLTIDHPSNNERKKYLVADQQNTTHSPL